MANIIYIATSLDGYIADKNGSLNWLTSIPNPTNSDFGFNDLLDRIDCIVMGRKTFESIKEFEPWPYSKKVFVLSNKIVTLPSKFNEKAKIIKGTPLEIIKKLNTAGYENIYVDGGVTIQTFLRENLIDELIITRVPILLGGGTPLFSTLGTTIKFEHINTTVLNDTLVKSIYIKENS